MMAYIKQISAALLLVLCISCGQTASAPGVVKNVAFSIEGMSCAHSCAPTIQENVMGINGVKEAKVSFENKVASVSYDDGITNPEAIKQSIESIAEGVYKVTAVNEIAQMPKDSLQ